MDWKTIDQTHFVILIPDSVDKSPLAAKSPTVNTRHFKTWQQFGTATCSYALKLWAI